MRITPLEIRKHPFRKTIMGFDRDQVNSVLQQIANEFEQLIKQNDELASREKILNERVDRYEKIEKTLNETLLTAQRATDEARLNAQKEAELIIKDAQIRADKYETQSLQKVNQLESDLMSLKTQRDSFLTRFKSMLRDQLSLLDVIIDGLKVKNDNKNKDEINHEDTESSYAQDEINHEDETMDELPPDPVV